MKDSTALEYFMTAMSQIQGTPKELYLTTLTKNLV